MHLLHGSIVEAFILQPQQEPTYWSQQQGSLQTTDEDEDK